MIVYINLGSEEKDYTKFKRDIMWHNKLSSVEIHTATEEFQAHFHKVEVGDKVLMLEWDLGSIDEEKGRTREATAVNRSKVYGNLIGWN